MCEEDGKQPNKKRIVGLHEGSMTMSDDFDAPLDDKFWTGERKYTSEDIHAVLFPNPDDVPNPPLTIEEMDEGIARMMREKYGRSKKGVVDDSES